MAQQKNILLDDDESELDRISSPSEEDMSDYEAVNDCLEHLFFLLEHCMIYNLIDAMKDQDEASALDLLNDWNNGIHPNAIFTLETVDVIPLLTDDHDHDKDHDDHDDHDHDSSFIERLNYFDRFSQNGENLLIMAIRYGNEEIAKSLLSLGVNWRRAEKFTFHVNSHGEYLWQYISCRQMAYEKGMISFVQLFDKLHANKKMKIKTPQSPIKQDNKQFRYKRVRNQSALTCYSRYSSRCMRSDDTGRRSGRSRERGNAISPPENCFSLSYKNNHSYYLRCQSAYVRRNIYG